MPVPSRKSDPLHLENALAPVLLALREPGLLVELLSRSPAGIALVEASPELTVVYCNDSFQRRAPLGRRPAVGRPVPELFSWTDRAGIRAGYREVIRTGRPLHRRSAPYHVRPGAAGDAIEYWNVSYFPLRDAGSEVTHVLSVAMDVTDQAGARARMTATQQRVLAAVGGVARHLDGHGEERTFFRELGATLAELVSATRAAFWLYDGSEQRTATAHPGAFGFAPDELERLSRLRLHTNSVGSVERAAFDGVVVRGELDATDNALVATGVRDTITIPWRSGERRLGAIAVYGSTRRAGFSEDDVWVLEAAATVAALVWDHRQADEALAGLREREAAGLRQQIEQSMQLEQLKTDFLKLASHELRGPLGVVRGYVSMMEDGTLAPVGEHVEPVLPLLRAKLDDMNRLINDMLETARLEDSALQLQLGQLDLRDVVHQAVRSLEPLAGEHHRLVTSVPGVPVPVLGDPARLGMVVTNLVHNALKYSPAGGEVRVTCTAGDGQAVVAVTDQGIGIAPDDIARLFTRFGRIVTPETAGIGGTGLGLYLARDIARRHGGDVTAESEPGRGSTFTLSLPQAGEPR
ncbi:MAG TPA: PAS domain-containing sensor histidine kinase [Candidatus Dormibacteraeota bacterium]|nr:PAS domain-containing sensor histidine kinase [Candidatus Dormibacteraeota bacterium]